MRRWRHIAFLCLCCSVHVAAQTLVYLEHSETLSFDQERIANAQILRGNVIFRHEDALMYCDSAYFYDQENSLDAFGHVRFEQG
ncbi:MAG: OstA-like protein, partial [Paludibacteraceae bacterium]